MPVLFHGESDSLHVRLFSVGYIELGEWWTQADHLRTMRRQLATQQANKTPVKLVLPLLFCFAPAALILLTGPAMMELRDFLVPKPEAVAGAEPGENFGGTGAVVRAIQGLEQGGVPLVGQQPTNPGPYVP